MLGYTVMEIIETQAFDVLINTFFWIILWSFMIIRLNRIEEKIK